MHPPGQLAALYYRLRQTRHACRPSRRTVYRQIEAEKKRLLVAGVPFIEVHLWCRHLTNPRSEGAAQRLATYLSGGSLRY